MESKPAISGWKQFLAISNSYNHSLSSDVRVTVLHKRLIISEQDMVVFMA